MLLISPLWIIKQTDALNAGVFTFAWILHIVGRFWANNLITVPPWGEAATAASHNTPWWPRGKGCSCLPQGIFSSCCVTWLLPSFYSPPSSLSLHFHWLCAQINDITAGGGARGQRESGWDEPQRFLTKHRMYRIVGEEIDAEIHQKRRKYRKRRKKKEKQLKFCPIREGAEAYSEMVKGRRR